MSTFHLSRRSVLAGSAAAVGVEARAVAPDHPDRVCLALGTYTRSWAGNGAVLRSEDVVCGTGAHLMSGSRDIGVLYHEWPAASPSRGTATNPVFGPFCLATNGRGVQYEEPA
ncbi:hypothetical protein [Streptomyces sp. NPDC056701]|uniref:hypothetical protein n=1 Tax=Streptomyces sp. NPDC056701 TaxID=3345916 RepID=UPI003688C60E